VPRQPDAPGMHGILVVAKPAGPTSHDVVALVRRLGGTRRIGHGGTLDPFASGVLPLFLGGATRLVEYHLRDDKTYRATVCFGAGSTTDDLDGELTPAEGPAPVREAFETALPTFLGTQLQQPPAYSAIQIGGRRAYAMARAGECLHECCRPGCIRAICDDHPGALFGQQARGCGADAARSANDNRHLARERVLHGHDGAHLMGGAGSTDWPGSMTNV